MFEFNIKTTAKEAEKFIEEKAEKCEENMGKTEEKEDFFEYSEEKRQTEEDVLVNLFEFFNKNTVFIKEREIRKEKNTEKNRILNEKILEKMVGFYWIFPLFFTIFSLVFYKESRNR